MIKVLMQVEGGRKWWILAHSLIARSSWTYDVRSINLFTFLVQLIVKGDGIYALSVAIENKLVALDRTHRDLVSCATAIGSVARDSFIRPYRDDQDFLSSLESHLHAIYTTLEVVADLNKQIDHTLPRGFRKQCKRYDLFSFVSNPWLATFYDLRTELTHYNTALPLRREGKLILEFRNRQKMEQFDPGRTEVDLNEVFNFLPQLLELLDRWAVELLKRLPKEGLVDVLESGPYGSEPKLRKIPLCEFTEHFKKLMLDETSNATSEPTQDTDSAAHQD